MSGTKLTVLCLIAGFFLIVSSAGLYHWFFLKGAQEGWPLIGSMVKRVVKDEAEQRDRFLRENLDLMARRVGEMQAKLLQLESLGNRVSGLAGIPTNDTQTTVLPGISPIPGRGGALVSGRPLTMDELEATLADLEKLSEQRVDFMTVLESRLFDQKIKKQMIPTQEPVAGGEMGSAFGWRIDPFSGRSALHTGLDFPAESGTPILAAAGGVVVAQEYHPAYGNMVEIDHGNDLVTRYAHASRVLIKKGDIVKRGQAIAEVGNTGRSTGPHLHFEVLVQGVFQDPQKFLLAGEQLQKSAVASRGAPRNSSSTSR